jgi:hypothetical protein
MARGPPTVRSGRGVVNWGFIVIQTLVRGGVLARVRATVLTSSRWWRLRRGHVPGQLWLHHQRVVRVGVGHAPLCASSAAAPPCSTPSWGATAPLTGTGRDRSRTRAARREKGCGRPKQKQVRVALFICVFLFPNRFAFRYSDFGIRATWYLPAGVLRRTNVAFFVLGGGTPK